MNLVGTAKRQFQMMRDGEWKHLMDDVSSFCVKHDILIPKMDDLYVLPGRLKCKVSTVIYSHHLRVEVFDAIDSQLQELDRCFDKVSNDLLLGMASLSPVNSFANYDKDKIMGLAKYYPNEFGDNKLQELISQLDDYIVYMRQSDNRFSNLKGLGDLSKALVETKLDLTWSLVYLLLELTLILPVAGASVERSFSWVRNIKSEMRKKFDEEFFNDCLVCYAESDVFEGVPDAAIINQFHSRTLAENN
ncbi:PREDICTED: uncharacterized protein LOC109244669 [Nicotiana attenuata]|uniref:uncharacterized protein LOC109244669 n=1 Tax=Nicotiana attenuata TaxID=49451 RepID=UPI000905D471|nr:PREDICTED: uncharacterized protein LOC109244669 [Nicotiana attenuata]